jgi:hypothetical protein
VRARLWLEIENTHFDDTIQFLWNNQPLTQDSQAWPGAQLFDRFEYCFDVPSEALREGENELELRLQERDGRLDPFVTLRAGRLTLEKGGPDSARGS